MKRLVSQYLGELTEQHAATINTLMHDFCDIDLPVDTYFNYRVLNDKLYCIQAMAYTYGVMCNVTANNVLDGRLCFDGLLNAVSFLDNWSGDYDDLPKIGEDGFTANKLLIT